MIKKTILLAALCLSIASIQAQTQLPIKHQAQIWLYPQGNIDTSQWSDASGNGHDAIWPQNTIPIEESLNFNPAFLLGPGFSPLKINYIPPKKGKIKAYVVYQSWDTAHENGIWNLTFDSLSRVGLSSHRILNIRKDIKYASSTDNQAIINALSSSWRKIKSDSSYSAIYVGGTDSLFYNGKFAEFLFFDKKPNKRDNELIHTYLALKYGITLNRINYINDQDTILWDTEAQAEYNHEVAGLVRDDIMLLNQKQAAGNGGLGELTLYLETLHARNDINQAHMPDINYLIWGHNNQALDQLDMDSVSMTSNSLINRKWRIHAYGDSIQSVATCLRIDAKNIDTASTIQLVICPDADGAFYVDSNHIYLPDSVDANHFYYFKNIHWDQDNSGADLFTFSIAPPFFQSFYSQTLRIDELGNREKKFEIQVYPNPSDGELLLRIEPGQSSNYQVEITDINGRLVKSYPLELEKTYTTKEQFFTSGIYFIKVSSDTESKTVKVVIK